jgi:GAF domain-containing protein
MLSLIVSLKAIIKAEGIRALSFIPLVAEGKLIGKFMTYYRDPYRFSLEEARLANSIAQQLAIGIDGITLRANYWSLKLAFG